MKSSLKDAMEHLRFDKRLKELNIAHGNITQAEWDQHIQSTQDAKNLGEDLKLTEGNDSQDDDFGMGASSSPVNQRPQY